MYEINDNFLRRKLIEIIKRLHKIGVDECPDKRIYSEFHKAGINGYDDKIPNLLGDLQSEGVIGLRTSEFNDIVLLRDIK